MINQTVEGMKRNFTKKEIELADEARRLYVILGRPSQKSFEDMIEKGKIVNNSVTVQDYQNALQMYGTHLGVLKGKTSTGRSEHLKVQFLENPKLRKIILSMDLMNFTGLMFLTMVSRNNKFITATMISDRKKTL